MATCSIVTKRGKVKALCQSFVAEGGDANGEAVVEKDQPQSQHCLLQRPRQGPTSPSVEAATPQLLGHKRQAPLLKTALRKSSSWTMTFNKQMP